METMLDRLRAEAPELLEAVTEERMTAAEGIVKTASPKSLVPSAPPAPSSRANDRRQGTALFWASLLMVARSTP